VDIWFDASTAVCALIAGVYWFLSAAGRTRKLSIRENGAAEPFYEALQFSARMNRWAAGFSGASAISAGCKLFLLLPLMAK